MGRTTFTYHSQAKGSVKHYINKVLKGCNISDAAQGLARGSVKGSSRRQANGIRLHGMVNNKIDIPACPGNCSKTRLLKRSTPALNGLRNARGTAAAEVETKTRGKRKSAAASRSSRCRK